MSEDEARARAIPWYRRRVARWSRDAAIVLALLVGVFAWQTRGHARGAAPIVAWRLLDDATASAPWEPNKPTLIVFWAPWCGVCAAETGTVSRVQNLVGARANVVSVASHYDSLDDVRQFITDHGVDYPVLLGGDDAARAYGVAAFPSAFILDEDGQIVSSMVGYTTTLGFLLRLWLA